MSVLQVGILFCVTIIPVLIGLFVFVSGGVGRQEALKGIWFSVKWTTLVIVWVVVVTYIGEWYFNK